MKTYAILPFLALASVATAQELLTLRSAIGAARANRPAIEAARLRVTQANLSRRAAGAFPTTRLFVGYTTPAEVGGSDDDLVLAQPLDVFGRTTAAKRAGDALVAQAEAELRQVSFEVQSQVTEALVEAAASAELSKAAAAQQETLQSLYDSTRIRVEEGVIPGIQLSRVEVELEQAKLRTQQRQAELRANERRLQTVLGTSASAVGLSGFPDIPIPSEADLPRQRPDLLLLAADVRSAEADARVARLEGMPELEVQGRRTPWQESNPQFGVRVQLSIPIFDHGRVRSETRAANTRAEAARRALADATQLAEGEVAASRIEVEAAGAQVRSYEALVATARALVERLRPGLTERATTLLEVIDATRSLRDVEEALVEARERLASAQARLLRATGHLIEVTN